MRPATTVAALAPLDRRVGGLRETDIRADDDTQVSIYEAAEQGRSPLDFTALPFAGSLLDVEAPVETLLEHLEHACGFA